MPIVLLINGCNYCNMLNDVIYDQFTRYSCNNIGGCCCIFTSVRKHLSYTLHFAHVPNIELKYKKIKNITFRSFKFVFVFICILSKLRCQSKLIYNYFLSASVKKNDQ